MTVLAAGVIACSTHDTDVGCSPSLACSLREINPPPAGPPDAGPRACDEGSERCHAINVGAGGGFSCAIAEAGELLCWGDDTEGQRGDGEPAIRPPAPQISRVLDRVNEITTGRAHACALLVDGSVMCWGRNREGQVTGVGSEAPVTSPARVPIPTAMDISAGDDHTCAVVETGVFCWGAAAYGQAGRDLTRALGPGRVAGSEGAIEVSAGARHTCSRSADGRVGCWGELIATEGSIRTRNVIEVEAVSGLIEATAIAAGAGYTCALHGTGGIACWGRNENGQLGDGTTNASGAPSQVETTTMPRALRLTAGSAHACAIDIDFHVWCWGRNTSGELGIGEGDDQLSPVIVLSRTGSDQPYLDEVTAIDAGAAHTCAVDYDGPALCWGDNGTDQLGARPDEVVSFGRATRVVRFGRTR